MEPEIIQTDGSNKKWELIGINLHEAAKLNEYLDKNFEPFSVVVMPVKPTGNFLIEKQDVIAMPVVWLKRQIELEPQEVDA